MAGWLVKGDPDDYGAAHLERDGSTNWTGVRNPLARKHLAAMKPGDEVLVYHTGDERCIVARARVTAAEVTPGAGPTLAFVARLSHPVTLAQVKADAALRELALVRNSRLSVMPVSAGHWRRLHALAQKKPTTGS